MATVIPCTGCERFVRSSDYSCPFCGAALTPQVITAAPRRHLARAAMVSLALAGACHPAPMYGGPAPDDVETTGGGTGSSDADSSDTDSSDTTGDSSDGADGTTTPDVEPAPIPIYGGAPAAE